MLDGKKLIIANAVQIVLILALAVLLVISHWRIPRLRFIEVLPSVTHPFFPVDLSETNIVRIQYDGVNLPQNLDLTVRPFGDKSYVVSRYIESAHLLNEDRTKVAYLISPHEFRRPGNLAIVEYPEPAHVRSIFISIGRKEPLIARWDE